MENPAFLSNYLNQQLTLVEQNDQCIQPVKVPTESELEQFKKHVKNFIDIDNDIKKLRAALKERNFVKKELTGFIIQFMTQFNIEDLNTKYGRIRYSVRHVKKSLPISQIKQRVVNELGVGNQSQSPENIADEIFKPNSIEKHSLRRLK